MAGVEGALGFGRSMSGPRDGGARIILVDIFFHFIDRAGLCQAISETRDLKNEGLLNSS
jgi:hypothetical protein